MFIDNKRNVCKLLWNKKAKILYCKIINLVNNNQLYDCLTITDWNIIRDLNNSYIRCKVYHMLKHKDIKVTEKYNNSCVLNYKYLSSTAIHRNIK